MAIADERLTQAGRALNKLREAVAHENPSEMERDALIKRFEFCVELLWKCGKDCLLIKEGRDAASPKRVIRELREVEVFDDAETALLLKMIDDRNLAAHTYSESMIEELAKRIKQDYEPLMMAWYLRMKT